MENPPKPLKFAPKILLAVCIGQLDDNYKKLAYKLNDKGESDISDAATKAIFSITFVDWLCCSLFEDVTLHK